MTGANLRNFFGTKNSFSIHSVTLPTPLALGVGGGGVGVISCRPAVKPSMKYFKYESSSRLAEAEVEMSRHRFRQAGRQAGRL